MSPIYALCQRTHLIIVATYYILLVDCTFICMKYIWHIFQPCFYLDVIFVVSFMSCCNSGCLVSQLSCVVLTVVLFPLLYKVVVIYACCHSLQKAITVAPAGASVSVKMTTPQKAQSVITGGQALVKPGAVRPTITLNTAAASASGTPIATVSQVCQLCYLFLSTGVLCFWHFARPEHCRVYHLFSWLISSLGKVLFTVKCVVILNPLKNKVWFNKML